jgi:hypothetical protein
MCSAMLDYHCDDNPGTPCRSIRILNKKPFSGGIRALSGSEVVLLIGQIEAWWARSL